MDRWSQIVESVRTAPPAATLAVHGRAARAVSDLRQAGELPKGVAPLRVALLRSVTAELLIPSLVANLAECGFAAEVQIGQLGNIAAECLSPDSFVRAQPFDAVMIFALAEHVLPDAFDPSAHPDDEPLNDFLSQIERLAASFGGVVVICNFTLPVALTAAVLHAHQPASGRYRIQEANRRLAEFAAAHPNVLVCDLDALASEVGRSRFWSPRDLITSMQPLTPDGLASLSRRLAELCVLYKRTPIKCIVLDCDNTLWGGVIGEDGLDGIQLGETYPGTAFEAFQRQLSQLNRVGFLLALNSKNNEPDVLAVFEKHPRMVLKLDQIAAMRVNWQDKASNMQELAEELNIGLDSFLFIDDSDFEINFLRERLPQVTCLQTPRQPWELPMLLPRVPWLDRIRVTAEDRKKAKMYAEEAQRRQFKSSSGDIRDYLHGLKIELRFEPFDAAKHVARAAQLTQKTNQFNLTTRRYTEAELLAMQQAGTHIYLASLQDRFGEYGRIAMAILKPTGEPGVCALDVFLMSCRVIGRGVEDSFLRMAAERMKTAGFTRLRAEFIPTAKNAVSAGFLASAGLTEIRRDAASGRIEYELDLTRPIAGPSEWLTVTSEQ